MIGLTLFGCQNQRDIQPIDKLTFTKNIVKDVARDNEVSALAKNLAFSMSSTDVRKFIKKNAILQFDGDYNFLIETTKNDAVHAEINGRLESVSFGSILMGLEGHSGRITNDGKIDDLISENPLLQVAIPELEEVGDAETWDAENEIPLVAYLPSDYDESIENFLIPAYDVDGNEFLLNSSEDPERLIIVISDNERLFAIPKSASSNERAETLPVIDDCPIVAAPYYESSEYFYYSKDDVYTNLNECNGGGGSGGGGTGGGSSGCDRETNNDRDYLNKAKFKDYGTIRQVESWASGKPEVRMIVSFAQANISSGYNFTG